MDFTVLGRSLELPEGKRRSPPTPKEAKIANGPADRGAARGQRPRFLYDWGAGRSGLTVVRTRPEPWLTNPRQCATNLAPMPNEARDVRALRAPLGACPCVLGGCRAEGVNWRTAMGSIGGTESCCESGAGGGRAGRGADQTVAVWARPQVLTVTVGPAMVDVSSGRGGVELSTITSGRTPHQPAARLRRGGLLGAARWRPSTRPGGCRPDCTAPGPDR
jgi:hypothetical protein